MARKKLEISNHSYISVQNYYSAGLGSSYDNNPPCHQKLGLQHTDEVSRVCADIHPNLSIFGWCLLGVSTRLEIY